MTLNGIHTAKPSEIISGRVCGIGDGDNIIISQQVIQLDSRLLRLCNWSVSLCYIILV